MKKEEDNKITNLALLIKVGSLKANNVINMDIVKPMPPKKPAPIMDFQLRSSGSLHIPKETAAKLNRKIPKGLPTIKPKAMPML